MKYPKAGDPNPTVTLAHRRRRRAARARSVDARGLRAGHHHRARRRGTRPARCSSRSRTASRTGSTWCASIPRPATVTKLLREESTSWVDVHRASREWLKDGSFLWLSDRTRLPARLPLRGGRQARARAHGGRVGGARPRRTSTRRAAGSTSPRRRTARSATTSTARRSRAATSAPHAGPRVALGRVERATTRSSSTPSRASRARPSSACEGRRHGRARARQGDDPGAREVRVRPARSSRQLEARDGFALDAMVIPPLGLDRGHEVPGLDRRPTRARTRRRCATRGTARLVPVPGAERLLRLPGQRPHGQRQGALHDLEVLPAVRRPGARRPRGRARGCQDSTRRRIRRASGSPAGATAAS